MAKFGRQTRIKFVGGELLVKVSGDENVIQNLTGVARRSQDLRIPFLEFRPVWIKAIQHTFDAGGDPVPWPELSDAYAGAVHGGDKTPTLRLSDRMYDSLTSQTSDTIWFAGPKSMQLGSRVPYFIYHQEGTSKMPARPMLTLPAEAAGALVTMVTNFIVMGKASRTRSRTSRR